MEKFLRLLQATMTEPKSGGAMHLIALASVLILTFILCVLFHDAKESVFRAILISIWAVLFLMEVISQISYSYTFTEDGSIVWSYHWGKFPLQLCDTPTYLLLPIALLKKGKLRDTLSAYMATYILLGGVATYAFPASIYTTSVYHNIHTLVHHGLQITSCIFIAVRQRNGLTISVFVKAICFFLIAVSVATLYNVVMHKLYPEQLINMFFISPYFVKTVPEVVNEAWHKMHWLSRIGLYIVGLTVISAFFFTIYRWIFHFEKKAKTEAVEINNKKETV